MLLKKHVLLLEVLLHEFQVMVLYVHFFHKLNFHDMITQKHSSNHLNKPIEFVCFEFQITTSDNENAMFSFLLNYGPPSVCVDAELWQFYRGGVVTG